MDTCNEQTPIYMFLLTITAHSLTWPDPVHTGTYQMEIISAVLRGSGTVHSTKILLPPDFGEC